MPEREILQAVFNTTVANIVMNGLLYYRARKNSEKSLRPLFLITECLWSFLFLGFSLADSF